ncbi:pLS20_p028 family conjugation system transmembrane protein [Weissella hellenica]|uniref:pLS20_p028 family conjugation system transmembrane protein n=1 Tax=Weissella hellenica TaxID=46256 RepID=UPI00388637A3
MIGLVPLPASGPTNAFYESWADYLQPKSRMFLSVLQMMCQGIADLCYDLANAVLTAWHAAWKLMDFSSLFTKADGSGQDMSGYGLTQYIGIFFMIGIIILALMLAIQVIQFNLTSGRRGKEWPAGIVTAVIIIAMVPLLISGGTQVAKSMDTELLGGTSTTDVRSGSHSILTDIWKNNSVDLKKVAQDNFNVDDKKIHDYSPIQKNSSNAIVTSSIFTDTIDDDAKKGMKDKAKDVFANKQGESTIKKVDKGGWLKGTEEVYPRVKVNWIGIIAAEIVFAIVGFLAIIELIVRFFRLAYYSLTLLALAFRDMEGKKAMQILHVMEGSILGMALLPLNLVLFFAFVQWGMTAINDQNLSWGPYTVVSVALLLAAGKGLLSGFALIDDWTGMPTGHGGTASGLIGAVAATAGVGRASKGLAGSAVRTAGAVGHGVAKGGQKAIAGGQKFASGAQAMKEKVNQAGKRGNATQQAVQGGASGGQGQTTASQQQTATSANSIGTSGLPINSAASEPNTSADHPETASQAAGATTTGANATSDTQATPGTSGSRTPAQAHNPGTQPGRAISGNAGTMVQTSQPTGDHPENGGVVGSGNTATGGQPGLILPNNVASSSDTSESPQASVTSRNDSQAAARPAVNPPKTTPTPSVTGRQSVQSQPMGLFNGSTVAPTSTSSPAMPNQQPSQMQQQQPNPTPVQPVNSVGTNRQPVNNQGVTSQRITSQRGTVQPTNRVQTDQRTTNNTYNNLQKEVQQDLRQVYTRKDKPQRS